MVAPHTSSGTRLGLQIRTFGSLRRSCAHLVPDWYQYPGVAGETYEDCEYEMREAIAFHIQGLAQGGEPVPQPHSPASYAVVDVA